MDHCWACPFILSVTIRIWSPDYSIPNKKGVEKGLQMDEEIKPIIAGTCLWRPYHTNKGLGTLGASSCACLLLSAIHWHWGCPCFLQSRASAEWSCNKQEQVLHCIETTPLLCVFVWKGVSQDASKEYSRAELAGSEQVVWTFSDEMLELVPAIWES